MSVLSAMTRPEMLLHYIFVQHKAEYLGIAMKQNKILIFIFKKPIDFFF